MKILISKPGIPIEKIDKNSFYTITNNNRSPIGGASLWSEMMLIGNIIYACSSRHPILYSEISIFAEPDDCNDILKDKYIIKRGNAKFNGYKILISDLNTLITQKNLNVLDKDINFITYVIPNITKDYGLRFSFDESIHFFIENNKNE